ncbi:pantetheine-phosphate adenylyltransferase [bacterium]|nr:pantetheine-phosphate adenylyltransferase [candidate division CSSED10-310 bacterium]
MIHAVYPGSFDPITNGHIDIIHRARLVFERLTVAVVVNPSKQPLFTLTERVQMIRDVLDDQGLSIPVASFDGLLVKYAETIQAQAVVRGLRALSDFEFEFQLSLMNRRLKPDIQMVYFMSSSEVTYLSSGLVKEVASLGGDVTGLVPPIVHRLLIEKLSIK